MPNYDDPSSDDTPCLDLPVDKQEYGWLALHQGHDIRLIERTDELLIECLTCDCFLASTVLTAKAELPDITFCEVCGLQITPDQHWVELECGDGYVHSGHECYGEHAGGCSLCPIGGDA